MQGKQNQNGAEYCTLRRSLREEHVQPDSRQCTIKYTSKISNQCCFILMLPCLMSSSFTDFSSLLLPKTMDLVLSKPKWILGVLNKPVTYWIKIVVQLFKFHQWKLSSSAYSNKSQETDRAYRLHRVRIIKVQYRSLWNPTCHQDSSIHLIFASNILFANYVSKFLHWVIFKREWHDISSALKLDNIHQIRYKTFLIGIMWRL